MEIVVLMLESIAIAIAISIVPAVLIAMVGDYLLRKIGLTCDDNYDFGEYHDYEIKKEQTRELLDNQDEINKTIANYSGYEVSKGEKQNENVKPLELNNDLESTINVTLN